MDALKKEISRITNGYDKVREVLIIYIYCQSEGSFIVSLLMLGNRTLTELWVLINKVCRSTELNELLRERLKEFSYRVSPEVIRFPYEVKFFKDNMIQTCSLDIEALLSPANSRVPKDCAISGTTYFISILFYLVSFYI